MKDILKVLGGIIVGIIGYAFIFSAIAVFGIVWVLGTVGGELCMFASEVMSSDEEFQEVE